MKFTSEREQKKNAYEFVKAYWARKLKENKNGTANQASGS